MSSRIPLPEQAPAARPIAEYTVMSWHWSVSAGFSGCLLAVSAAVVQAVHRAGARIDEHARAGNDFGFLRRRHRNLDHVDAEQRGVRIFIRLFAGAACQFFRLTHERCA